LEELVFAITFLQARLRKSKAFSPVHACAAVRFPAFDQRLWLESDMELEDGSLEKSNGLLHRKTSFAILNTHQLMNMCLL